MSWPIFTNEFDNLDEMDISIRKYNLTNLTQEVIEKMNYPNILKKLNS